MDKGYQLVFYTEESRIHNHLTFGGWLLEMVRSMHIRGATLIKASEGIGRHHHLHSAQFFEMADQPVVVTVVVSEEECERLLKRINVEENLRLFYTKIPVEFGLIGG